MSSLALLECGIVKEISDARPVLSPTSTEYCPRCLKWEDVHEYYSEEWHSTCLTCGYGRKHGLVRAYADRAAALHSARYPAHRVAVRFYGVRPRNWPEPYVTQVTLPGLECPPF